MDTNELKRKLNRFGTDVMDSAGKLTKNAVDGSKKMKEKIRIQTNIRKAEKSLQQTYIDIGQKYEELYGNRNDPDFSPYMAEIADFRAQIAAFHAELNSLSSAGFCGNCGNMVKENQKFCPSCGAKIKKTQPVDAEIISPEQEYQEY